MTTTLASRSRWRDLLYAIALVFSTSVGVMLLQDEPGWPSKFWHWMWPVGFVGLIANTIQAVFAGAKRSWILAAIWVVAATVAAWMLTPTWTNLSPTRPLVAATLAAYLSVLTIAFELVSKRLFLNESSQEATRQLIVAITFTGLCLSASIAATSGLKYGELAAVIAVGVAGCVAAHGWQTGRDSALATLAPVAGLLVGCAAFVGVIYPQQPVLRLLPLPFAPLAIPLALRFFKTDSWQDIGFRYAVFLAAVVASTVFAVV